MTKFLSIKMDLPPKGNAHGQVVRGAERQGELTTGNSMKLALSGVW